MLEIKGPTSDVFVGTFLSSLVSLQPRTEVLHVFTLSRHFLTESSVGYDLGD